MKKGNIKYSKYIKSIKTNDHYRFRESFINRLYNIQKTITNETNLRLKNITSYRWRLFNSKGNGVKTSDYELLWDIANTCRVKIMWEIMLLSPTEFEQGLRIIGEESKVRLCIALLDIYFQFEYLYIKFAIDKNKKTGVNLHSVKADASRILKEQRRIIHNIVKDELVFDPGYTYWLKNMVTKHFKLNYKKYKTDKHEYYHAISRKFCHKRMIC